MIVICNATPLINFAAINRLDILEAVFSQILIPQAVYHETTVTGFPGSEFVLQAIASGWLQVRSVSVIGLNIPTELDQGEREAIALAIETGETRILLDEREARQVAQNLGLQVIDPLDAAIYDAQNDELVWRSHATHISPLLADLLDEMMAHKPKQRPANTQVILQRLAEIEQALNPPKVTRRTNPPRVAPTQLVNTPQPQVKTPAPTLPVNPPQPPVTTQTTTVGWGLWLEWMLANTVALLVWLGMFNMNLNQSSSHPLTVITLLLLLPGTLWGSIQWLILRQLFPCKWWVLFTVLGTVIGVFLAAMLPILSRTYDSRWVSAVFSGAVCGASLGLMQWFVLKRQIRLAGWWIVANAVGGMTVFYATMLGYLNSNNTGGLVFGSLAFTVFGAITGGTLVWLMRQPDVKY